MFNKDIYVSRRQALKEKVGSGLILFLGNEEVGMSFHDNTYKFRQDSSFLYYFGIDKPSLTAIIDLDNDKEVLFGDELTIDNIVWTGPQEPLAHFAEKSGIATVKPTADIASALATARQKGQPIHFLPPYRDEHTLKLQEWLHIKPSEAASKASVTLIKAIVSMRSHKKAEEIKEIDKAIDVSADMHEAMMKMVADGKTELEIAAYMQGMALGTGGDISYPVILTVNGETLHIHARNVQMHNGQLALCDAGAESAMHYAGDLTRTVPVNGKFTQVQKDMYNLILDIQLKCIEACKPGVLFRDVHGLAGEMLLEGLKGFGIIKGDVKDALAHDVHTLFFQCGLGHMMGLDVHDMENLGEPYVGYTETLKKKMVFGWKSLRLGRALEPGFVVTMEPGIYFIPTLIDMWKSENKLSQFVNYKELEKFRHFSGIRIEDDILITENGSRILGNKMPPKTVAEIEDFQAKK